MPENQIPGEVLWPKLVANKLLKRPVGSHSFVSDFTPSTETSFLDFNTKPTNGIYDDQSNMQKYKLFVSTWNVGGVAPADHLNLEDWLDIKNNSYDIYVLGFQEIVPLKAKNVLGPEKSRISMKWNSLIRATLNKSICMQDLNKNAGDRQKVHPVGEGFSRNFRCIISKHMVGILTTVWVRSDILPFIRHPSASCVGCGIIGCLGNKGSVSVRFCLHKTSFCFICCHLASGGKEGDQMHRNSDAVEILTRTSFPPDPLLDLPQKIFDHDQIVILGDLNYRISLPEATTRSLVQQKRWNTLLEKDQLRSEVWNGGVFEGWHEGQILFSPTYKYYPNSDKYYGSIEGKKGEKRRSPAWCDRILWHGKGMRQKQYDRCELRLSDHRPVRAVFNISVEVPNSLNSLRSFFLSDRFELNESENTNDLINQGPSSNILM